jgi:5-methylcytosine-specific restriction endonuclease McrA
MNHVSIRNLAALFRNTRRYKVTEPYPSGELHGFHQWADGRPCEGAFLVERTDGASTWILLIDWKRSENYYVVVFEESRLGPVCELHKVKDIDGLRTLEWTYRPSKRDGNNDERKQYFQSTYGADTAALRLPEGAGDIDDFIGDLIELADYRLKADILAENVPATREWIVEGFPEGRRLYRMHTARERNPKLIREAKKLALKRDGVLRCTCCNFDFSSTYGEVGHGYIEAHHTTPLSSLEDSGGTTLVEDLALVCANCHRMLHRRRPWLEADDLAEILEQKVQPG